MCFSKGYFYFWYKGFWEIGELFVKSIANFFGGEGLSLIYFLLI